MSFHHDGVNNVNGNFNNVGGHSVFNGPISVGADPAPRPGGGTGTGRDATRAEVGVLTVINQEIRAVSAVLRGMRDYRVRRMRSGPLAYEAWLPDPQGRPVRIAAVQALEPGTEQAALAYRGLVEEYRPAAVLLVGVAGGISPAVKIGDVVISDQVIAYDARRETPDGARRRGRTQTVAAALGHRLNEFMAMVPEQQSRPGGEPFQLHRGPIGTGNAVVTDVDSEIRHWLRDFNEKVLAVETESAGVAQSFHENVVAGGSVRGWLTVRGISDTADAGKGHQYHDLAAGHAAEVMAMLVPHLSFEEE